VRAIGGGFFLDSLKHRVWSFSSLLHTRPT